MQNTDCNNRTTYSCELLIIINTLVFIILALELRSRGLVANLYVLLVLVFSAIVLTVLSQAIRRRKRKLNLPQTSILDTKENDSDVSKIRYVMLSVVLFVSLFIVASLKVFSPNVIMIKTPELHQAVVRSLDTKDSGYSISLQSDNKEYSLVINSLFARRMRKVHLGDEVSFSFYNGQLIALYKNKIPIFRYEEFISEQKSAEKRVGFAFYLIAFGYLFWFLKRN